MWHQAKKKGFCGKNFHSDAKFMLSSNCTLFVWPLLHLSSSSPHCLRDDQIILVSTSPLQDASIPWEMTHWLMRSPKLPASPYSRSFIVELIPKDEPNLSFKSLMPVFLSVYFNVSKVDRELQLTQVDNRNIIKTLWKIPASKQH